MAKVIPLFRVRSDPAGAGDVRSDVEYELWPVAALLFVASLARVARALWTHAAFDTEPTLALLFVLGLPWLALRRCRKSS
jgi:hypothetical protein